MKDNVSKVISDFVGARKAVKQLKQSISTTTMYTPETFYYIDDAKRDFGQYKSDNYVLCHLCDNNTEIERNGYKEHERNALFVSPCVVVCFDCRTACAINGDLWKEIFDELNVV